MKLLLPILTIALALAGCTSTAVKRKENPETVVAMAATRVAAMEAVVIPSSTRHKGGIINPNRNSRHK